jgi:hypothetical protein
LPFGGFFLPWNPEWEMSTSLDETSSLRKIVGDPLVQNLADLSLQASHSKVICRYGTFLPTLSKSEWIHHNLEGIRDSQLLSITFNNLS